MIKTFKHAGLREFFETGKSAKVNPDLRKRIRARLEALALATKLQDLPQNIGLHLYTDVKPPLYSVDVSGPWRILFNWEEGAATNVDLVQPH
jgi:proteic killer suppression protein